MNFITGKKVVVVGMNSIAGTAFTVAVGFWVASKVLLSHSHRQCSTNFHHLYEIKTISQMQTVEL